jgi:hypothetical protein
VNSHLGCPSNIVVVVQIHRIPHLNPSSRPYSPLQPRASPSPRNPPHTASTPPCRARCAAGVEYVVGTPTCASQPRGSRLESCRTFVCSWRGSAGKEDARWGDGGKIRFKLHSETAIHGRESICGAASEGEKGAPLPYHTSVNMLQPAICFFVLAFPCSRRGLGAVGLLQPHSIITRTSVASPYAHLLCPRNSISFNSRSLVQCASLGILDRFQVRTLLPPHAAPLAASHAA